VVRIGPLPVRTGRAEVDAFARALGLSAREGPVPLTFPIRWLGPPELRRKLVRDPGSAHTPLVQQSQLFEYRRPLVLDRDYLMEAEVACSRTSSGRVALRATIRDDSGDSVLVSDTVLHVLHGSMRLAASRRVPPPGDGAIRELWVGPIDAAQIQAYAEAALDDNPLHRDADAARAAGLKGPVVHGMLLMGQFEGALLAWRPELRVTRAYASFLHPLPVGGRFVVGGRIARSMPRGEGEALIVRLLARNERDELLVVGEVEAIAPTAEPVRRLPS
jgi:acyl dehydratase